MPAPNLRLLSSPLGPLRDKYSQTIGSDDFALPSGFVCQAATAGDVVYRTLEGSSDQTETVAIGDIINAAGIPVVLVAIRGASTVTSIVVGVI